MEYNRNSLKENRRNLRNNPTNAEVKLWGYLKKRQIENVKFRRQFSLDNFIVDFYSPETKLSIEVDGDTHFKDDEIKYDRKRQHILEEQRVFFLRFTNTEVFDSIDHVVARITQRVRGLLSENPIQLPLSGGES